MHVALPKNKRKTAFTLAEVLITLGIIGVVAALTLPTLIQNYQEQVTVTKVKKFYSVFSQAYAQAIQDNGTMDTWGLEETVVEDGEDGNLTYSESSIEESEKFLKILDKYIQKITYEKLKKYNKRDYTNGYVLPDGTAITAVFLTPNACISSFNGKCADVYIRTQGKSNDETKSKYMFGFYVYKYRIVPRGLSTDELDLCLGGKNYSNCTAWAMYNGNMDYLHCNDLSWNGKRKCK